MELPHPNKKTILVVDDDDTICSFFETVLLREGFNVFTVQSGEKALTLLKGDLCDKIDLVILDLMMPGRGGYDILRELQSPDYQNVPIIVATARTLDKETVDSIKMESNVQGFFSKPLNMIELKKTIRKSLGM
jgi:DNA-binding response OmpR family regulator